eukprot:TRINITY_DN44483_c0_g1_i1.p1 TRINITY_DN44483_c0_g1~~TRINITY_DN44483_c0_g1_i1.p1  ORF type:complete len:239 (+),score=76.87 TRINITY_DN44483_c0_g1_i1:144-860(+)
MQKIGVEVFYDYRDDDLYHEQMSQRGVLPRGPIHFSDESFNSIWAMYRPTRGLSMEEQLKVFYKTPMEDAKAEKADGIFKGGIPFGVLHPLAEFWVQHPLLKPLRMAYENCKIEKQNPNYCLNDGVAYAETMNRVAEQPFAKCPKETVGWTKCLDDNARNYYICRDLQVEWETCMKTHFDMKFPPFPLHPRRYEWNAEQSDEYRNRFKVKGRDAVGDLHRHVGLGITHPGHDLYADNF